jgi:DNA-binding transcriptional regulator YhcF (GntR family)
MKEYEVEMYEDDCEISCIECGLYYVLRKSDLGYFFGCCDFPYCRSKLTTSKVAQIYIDNYDILEYISKNGINIFNWTRECWKCNTTTPIYSYILNYDLANINSNFLHFGDILLGEIRIIDKMLLDSVKTVKKAYSSVRQESYIANKCIQCNRLQGAFYLFASEEGQKVHNYLEEGKSLDDFVYKTVYPENILSVKQDIELFYKNYPSNTFNMFLGC